uniref:SERTA domain containing 2 n=1 Tax=Gasterosteus aculeatus TaxID=69293 RepID=G3NIM7_GASAC
RYMFGKGAKRKLDEDEEGLEGKTLEAPVAAGLLGAVPEGLSKVSYTLQRQTIFNISLMKLYSQRPLGEPRLERRVLINNMLRRIQDELKQEGDPMDEGFREAPPSFGGLSAAAQPSQPSALLMPAVVPPPSPHPMAPQACPAPLESRPAPLESCLTPGLFAGGGRRGFGPLKSIPAPQGPAPASSSGDPPPVLSDMELDPPTAITRTAAANTRTVTTSPALTPLTQPPHLQPAGPLRDSRTTGAKPEAAGVLLAEARCGELRPLDAPPPAGLGDISPTSPSPSSPSGFLSDLALDDVLFADIDTSMYDFDPCTITKLPPMVTADDLLKSLASPYSGPAPQVSANQPFKIDLTELDHIMEVLVGS